MPSGKVRRLTVSAEDAALQRRQDHERSASPPADETAQPRRRSRPASRNSWIKRFSFMSSGSGSPVPSDGGFSPTLAQSVDAKSFSQGSSTAPILGSRPATANPGPNKLVKRQSSRRLVGDPGLNSKHLTLPRPATSHQRSAALQYHAYLNSQLPEDLSFGSEESENPPKWKQFFGIRMKKSSLPQARHVSSDDPARIRRIIPDDRYIPTLISAKTILSSSLDIDDISVDDYDSLDFGSRPGSSKEFAYPRPMSAALGSTIEEPLESTDLSTPEDSPVIGSGQEADGLGINRTFSFSSLIRRRPSSRQSSTKKPLKLIKRNSRRVISEPIRSVGLQIDQSDDERPTKRRLPSMSRKEVAAQQSVRHEQATAQLTAPGEVLSASPIVTSGNSSPSTMSENNSPNIPHSKFYMGRNRPIHSTSDPYSIPNSQSPNITHNKTRQSNASAAISDQLSTLLGSENETSRAMASPDDEDTDHSTLFDSFKTRGTRSTSGANKRRIETIFDETPSPSFATSPKLRSILPEGMLGTPSFGTKDFRPVKEEEDIINTPVRTIRSDRADDGSPTATRIKPRVPLALQLSPPDMTKALSLGTLEYDDEPIEDDDESRWSYLDEDSRMDLHEDDAALNADSSAPGDHSDAGNVIAILTASSTLETPKFGPEELRRDTLSSLFNWSEQHADSSPGNRSPPRPRTVHGKKDTARGSRSAGRRAPSGLHARSQSVPVVPGLTSKREPVVTNKFGTWGVGSKGVSDEIWDEDFDFGDGEGDHAIKQVGESSRRVDSGMHIPQTIREQQAKVVNNIGLVREFGLLIEELKANRKRASDRGLLDSPRSQLWQQVDAMIELADQEVTDPLLPIRTSPPSSPTADFDTFEDAGDSLPQARQMSTPNSRRNRSRRRSVLPSDNDVFSTPASHASQALTSSPVVTPGPNRPRKDSEAMARSVIEALHRRKDDTPDTSLALKPVPSHKKVPFDTNTLRYIVTHVQKLVRRVETSLHDSEDQNETSFASSSSGAPLTAMFKDPNRLHSEKSRRLKLNDNSLEDSDDINIRLKDMDLE